MNQEIMMRLKDLVSNNNACTELGLNPYCVNEGANGDEWVKVKTLEAC